MDTKKRNKLRFEGGSLGSRRGKGSRAPSVLNGSSYSLENVQVLARRRSGSPTWTVPRMWVTDRAVFPVTVYRGACSPVPFSRPRGERRPINQPIGFQTARPLAQLLRAAEGRWSWAPGPPAVGGSGQVREAACGCSAGQRHTLRLLRAAGRGAVSASPTPAEARVWRMHRSAELHRADTDVRVAAALGAGRRRLHAAAAEGPGL